MNKFIVIAIEYGETCNGHSSFLKKFNTREEAEQWVREDMIDVMNCAGVDYEEPDFIRHEVWVKGCVGTNGCVWDIIDTDSPTE